MKEKLLFRKNLAEKMLERKDLDSYSRKEWQKELDIVNNKLAKLSS